LSSPALLDTVRARLSAPPVTRFAPSPTGHLHLGHVVNAIYVWGIASALDGVVQLRIEDHDRERSRPEYERSLLNDLRWLGFLSEAASKPVRQSGHPERYNRAIDVLSRAGHTYWCDCSRQRIASAAEPLGGERRYDGRCRSRNLAPGPGRGLRVTMASGEERFDDGLLGPVVQDPSAQSGDVLVRDRLGNWTYQFAVVVDDLSDGVTLVVRGLDLLASTGRQLRLARLLGRPTMPVFVHHPLVLSRDGKKLSKSYHDTGIRELRQAGLSAADVIGRAAAAAGLIDEPRPIAANEVAELFRRAES
jgi:glutamyl/glutaminyl-tRNA synthetase